MSLMALLAVIYRTTAAAPVLGGADVVAYQTLTPGARSLAGDLRFSVNLSSVVRGAPNQTSTFLFATAANAKDFGIPLSLLSLPASLLLFSRHSCAAPRCMLAHCCDSHHVPCLADGSHCTLLLPLSRRPVEVRARLRRLLRIRSRLRELQCCEWRMAVEEKLDWTSR